METGEHCEMMVWEMIEYGHCVKLLHYGREYPANE
jgi:hypothetical protein